MFYLKMAWNNLLKTKNIYGPFLLTSTVLYVTLCSTLLILFSPISDNMSYGKTILGFGVGVLTLLSTILIIYSYRFVLKQRSKEFGLYNVLGMSKKKVSLISSIEILMIFLGLIFLGSSLSIIFSNLLYLIFVNLIHYDKLLLTFTPISFLLAGVIFSGIFILLLIINLLAISKSSPLDLFKTSAKAEQEPKGNVVMAILSVVLLGIGYALSFTSTKIAALALIYRFLIAVVLVILGTYLFYVSFTTWYLKRRRQNKAYYYQTEHFITVSQMLFRMKQNAVGLANITILAVMSFVTIATTSSIFGNTETMVNQLFPKNTELQVHQVEGKTSYEEFAKKTIIPELHKDDKALIAYQTGMISMPLTRDKEITVNQKTINHPKISQLGFVYVIEQDEFRKLGNDLPKLKANQTAFFKQKGDSQLKKLTIFGKDYDNIKNFKSVKMPDAVNTYNPGVLVVSSLNEMTAIKKQFENIDGFGFIETYKIFADLTAKDYQRLANKKGIWTNDKGEEAVVELTREVHFKNEAYALTGGFLFTGLLLGTAFLLAAALIIYYKRYSEGVEDQKSYHILQEVGMSKTQVKKIIGSQTLMVFFMPLIMAICHFLVAMIMLKQMLLLFGVVNDLLIYQISGGVILTIIIIYYLIYRLTGRTYYHLIER
ncbi:FtsX-like permease family protein [Streptococcus jiangjianxini]|uniref:FtsX-like permease family protein n=1 Tax=Streptococcus jiangjianxini TaxID=3161189 RepID=UPI0032EAA0F4